MESGIRGALHGLAVGDALGAITEGMDPASIREKYGRITGLISAEQEGTDDTEFAVYYTLLLEKYGLKISAAVIADHWMLDIHHKSGNYKGAGFSEAMTLQNLEKGLRPPESGRHLHAWSDGLAMCAAVFGCVHPGDPASAARLAEIFGSVSHHGEGIYGGQAVAAAVAAAIGGSDIDGILGAALGVIPADSWTAFNIKKAEIISVGAESAEKAIDILYDELAVHHYPWPDLAPEAVGIAMGLFACAGGDFTEAVTAAVNLGRDSDTIAAITGALCAAFGGIEAVPQDFVLKIDSVPGRCIRSVAGVKLQDTADRLLRIGGGEKES